MFLQIVASLLYVVFLPLVIKKELLSALKHVQMMRNRTYQYFHQKQCFTKDG